MQETRAGKFFLKPRGKRGTWYICWYNSAKRQTDGITTGTTDHAEATRKFLEHVTANGKKTSQDDAQLAELMSTYMVERGEQLPSVSCFRAAVRDVLAFWNDPNVSTLTIPEQRRFVAHCRMRGAPADSMERGVVTKPNASTEPLSDFTIDRRLRDVWAMINYAEYNGTLTKVPPMIKHDDWKPNLESNKRALSIEELAQLFNAAAPEDAAQRAEREHWFRFLVGALGTGSRGTALLELHSSQVAMPRRALALNPKGRRQTKKRRPTILMCDTLASWVESWGEGQLITYRGEMLQSLEFFDSLRDAAGIPDASAHLLRHTVNTWLVTQGVPNYQRLMFMGWKSQDESGSSGDYTHINIGDLSDAAAAIQRLFEAIAPHVKHVDLLRRGELVDQPEPESVATAWQMLTGLGVQVPEKMERETRLELATSTLARSPRSTRINNLSRNE